MSSRNCVPMSSIPVIKRFYTIGLIVGFINARKNPALYIIGEEN